MERYVIRESTLQAIGDAIRNKVGISDTMNPQEMVDTINSIIVHTNGDLDGLIMRTSEDIESDTATSVASYAFFSNPAVRYIVLPNALSIGDYAFCDCVNLENVSLGATRIGAYSFYNCDELLEIIFQYGLTEIGVGAFDGCKSLTKIDLSDTSLQVITASSFANSGIRELYLPKTKYCALLNANAFSGSPLGADGEGGIIYMPMQYRVRYESNSVWAKITGNGKNRIMTY